MMTQHFSDSSSLSCHGSTTNKPFLPPGSGYKMLFVINMQHERTPGIIAREIADASILLYRHLIHSGSTKLIQWELGDGKKEIYVGANQNHLEYIKRMSQFLNLPFICVSKVDVSRGITPVTNVIGIFGSNTAIGHVSAGLCPYK